MLRPWTPPLRPTTHIQSCIVISSIFFQILLPPGRPSTRWRDLWSGPLGGAWQGGASGGGRCAGVGESGRGRFPQSPRRGSLLLPPPRTQGRALLPCRRRAAIGGAPRSLNGWMDHAAARRRAPCLLRPGPLRRARPACKSPARLSLLPPRHGHRGRGRVALHRDLSAPGA